jgi:hypothetical protein
MAGAQGRRYQNNLPTVLESGSLKLLQPSGPAQAWTRIALPFYMRVISSFALGQAEIILEQGNVENACI